METITKRVTEKAINDITDKLRGDFPHQLTRKQALVARDRLEKFVKLKRRQFYKEKEMLKPLSFAHSINALKKQDSMAEGIVYRLLEENGVLFQFQYKIGPYRADFLIGDDLVFELDGPTHFTKEGKKLDLMRDKYMESKGYKVLRVPIWLMQSTPQIIVDEINRINETPNLPN